MTKGRGKTSFDSKSVLIGMLAAGAGFGSATSAAVAAVPNSFAVGVLGTGTANSACISSADGGQIVTNADCTSVNGARQAGIVSYNSSGNPGAYLTVIDPNTVLIGAGGVDQLKITNSGLFALNTLNMGGKQITKMAAGAVSATSTDAVNGSQLFNLQTTVNNLPYLKAGGKGDGSDQATVGYYAGDNIAIGSKALADTGFLGAQSDVAQYGQGAIAIGSNARATGGGSQVGYEIAIGSNAAANLRGKCQREFLLHFGRGYGRTVWRYRECCPGCYDERLGIVSGGAG
ncbi:hypothetical protein [Paraburkholderia sp. RL17-337-BIB-A]|uniref:hypothetical protein n=1 Tax=Paraburkholderia sp. RL17-337-BIB-A TaxID=3031636 RepID=UPI0038BE0F45